MYKKVLSKILGCFNVKTYVTKDDVIFVESLYLRVKSITVKPGFDKTTVIIKGTTEEKQKAFKINFNKYVRFKSAGDIGFRILVHDIKVTPAGKNSYIIEIDDDWADEK